MLLWGRGGEGKEDKLGAQEICWVPLGTSLPNSDGK